MATQRNTFMPETPSRLDEVRRGKRRRLVVAISIGLSVFAAACGGSVVSTTPAQTPTQKTSTSAAPQSTTSSSGQKAGVGSTIDLSDSANGDRIAVTEVNVADPDASNNEFETPSAGARFESIQFRIVNLGSGTYQDDPQSAISATDAAGQTMQEAAVTSTAAGAQMPSAVTLAPGDTALGYVTFNVPSGDSIAKAQYSMNAGLASGTGEWQVTGGHAPSSAAPPSTNTQAVPPPPAAPTTPASPSATSGTSSAQAVVEQYFAAINSGNYALAWSLGGMNIEQGSYNSFVQGFANTSSDNVTIVSTSGDTVSVALDATQTDGSHKYFTGTYTVKNGVIVAADIH